MPMQTKMNVCNDCSRGQVQLQAQRDFQKAPSASAKLEANWMNAGHVSTLNFCRLTAWAKPTRHVVQLSRGSAGGSQTRQKHTPSFQRQWTMPRPPTRRNRPPTNNTAGVFPVWSCRSNGLKERSTTNSASVSFFLWYKKADHCKIGMRSAQHAARGIRDRPDLEKICTQCRVGGVCLERGGTYRGGGGAVP